MNANDIDIKVSKENGKWVYKADINYYLVGKGNTIEAAMQALATAVEQEAADIRKAIKK